MKNHTSRLFKFVSLLLMGMPLTYLPTAILLFKIPLAALPKLLISPFFYLPIFLMMAAGYGLWEMKRWAWYVLIIGNIFHTYENIYVLTNHGDTERGFISFLISISIQTLLILIVRREVRVPYFFPKIRWWESNPRFKPSFPALIARPDHPTDSGEILDFSFHGCFIKTPIDIPIDTQIMLETHLFGRTLSIPGTVVWKAPSAVTHPKGVGVKFQNLNRSQKRSVFLISKRVKQISVLLGRTKYIMSPDEVIKELDSLLKTPILVGKKNPASFQKDLPSV